MLLKKHQENPSTPPNRHHHDVDPSPHSLWDVPLHRNCGLTTV